MQCAPDVEVLAVLVLEHRRVAPKVEADQQPVAWLHRRVNRAQDPNGADGRLRAEGVA
jgi:hypothetical protein